ncbi:hypothetical protein RFI_08238, partial [Reticulomyxa filosa]
MSFDWDNSSKKKNENKDSNFVRLTDHLKSLSEEKQKPFMQFELQQNKKNLKYQAFFNIVCIQTTKRTKNDRRNVIKVNNEQQEQVKQVTEVLQQFPDMSSVLKAYSEETEMLMDKLERYKHDLEPLFERLRIEFSHVHQAQVERLNRKMSGNTMSSFRPALPPTYYVDQIKYFETKIEECRNGLKDIQQHLRDYDDKDFANRQLQSLSPEVLVHTLQSTHRATEYIAGQVVLVHKQVEDLKNAYRKFRTDRYGDTTDPFSQTSKSQDYRRESIKTLELSGLQHFEPQPVSWGKKQEETSQPSNEKKKDSWSFDNNTNKDTSQENWNFDSSKSSQGWGGNTSSSGGWMEVEQVGE